MHPYCGPLRLKADGETPAKHYWSENSDFWPVFNKWVENGEKVNEFGRGITTDS
jgi:hypothetical protein